MAKRHCAWRKQPAVVKAVWRDSQIKRKSMAFCFMKSETGAGNGAMRVQFPVLCLCEWKNLFQALTQIALMAKTGCLADVFNAAA